LIYKSGYENGSTFSGPQTVLYSVISRTGCFLPSSEMHNIPPWLLTPSPAAAVSSNMGVSSGYVRRHEVGAVLAILASQRMGHQLCHLSQGDGTCYVARADNIVQVHALQALNASPTYSSPKGGPKILISFTVSCRSFGLYV
jgi:hypothetical protein